MSRLITSVVTTQQILHSAVENFAVLCLMRVWLSSREMQNESDLPENLEDEKEAGEEDILDRFNLPGILQYRCSVRTFSCSVKQLKKDSQNKGS